MDDSNAQLILVVTASYKGSVGFGDIFDCEIKQVIAGSIDETRIKLSVLAADRDTLAFISEHLNPTQIEIGFAIHQTDEPYNTAPISGFVDKSKTSWKVEFIRFYASSSHP
jgi:hypothetical protein